MKKLSILLLFLCACQSKGQVDLGTVNAKDWQADLDFLTTKIDSRFAGFTPELKVEFGKEAAKLRAELPKLNTNQRIMEFARLLALLHDGHTELSLVGSGSGFGRIPVVLYYFGSELRIVSASQSHASLLGARVTKIGMLDEALVFERLKPYMNHDNEVEFITTAPILMTLPEVLEVIGAIGSSASVPLTIRNEAGESSEVVLPRMSLKDYQKTEMVRVCAKTPLYLEGLEKGYVSKYLENENLLYVNFITLYDQDNQVAIKRFIRGVVEELDRRKPGQLVIDLRVCRGGNYNNIVPLIGEIRKRRWINAKGHLWVVNGRLTFSAAAVATVLFKDQTEASVVGEVCRARPNWAENMESYDLPHTQLNFDVLEETKVQSPALGNSLTIPVDVVIPRSFELYRQGEDEVLNYIIAEKKKGR